MKTTQNFFYPPVYKIDKEQEIKDFYRNYKFYFLWKLNECSQFTKSRHILKPTYSNIKNILICE